MQNRGALWIFTILLALACAYQLSFSFFTGRVEEKARQEAAFRTDSMLRVPGNENLDSAQIALGFENEYLRVHGKDRAYPLLGFTYSECKELEINLGLDLKGGMAVTVEVSVPELVENLSGKSEHPAFKTAMANARERQKSSSSDFITLFAEEYAKVPDHPGLSAIFFSNDGKQIFDREGTDADYIAVLRREAQDALDNTERILRTRIDQFGVAQPSIQKQQFTGRISVELPGVKDKERVRKLIQGQAKLGFWECFDNAEIGPLLDQVNKPLSEFLHPELASVDSLTADSLVADSATADVPDTAVTAAADTLDFLDSLDLASDTLMSAADSAAKRAEAEKRAPLAMKLMLMFDQRSGFVAGPVVGRARVEQKEKVDELLALDVVKAALPADVKFAWSAKSQELELNDGGTADFVDLYALRVPRDKNGEPDLDGKAINQARQDYDMKGEVEVRMSMTSEGAAVWRTMTANNVGKCIAIVLDDLVQSAPVVQGEIPSGQSTISMGGGDVNSQLREAIDLANVLEAGALPAPARIIDETVVGPSLGAENVESGLMSFIVALIGVLLVMALYYARAGWIADIALLVNVFFLLGAMASMQATLTLPGIAGIVLTIGMAVDANVLINERIRDELKHGRMLKSAVETAYSNQGALSAIIDSNVTTFVTAVILYYFGSGPIRGFATTLGLGILTSLFTAIFISRLIMTGRLDKGKSISFWRGWNKNLFDGANVDFMGKRRVFYIVSSIVIGIGVYFMATRSFNWGVDFTGGRTYVVEFAQTVDPDAVRATLEPVVKENGRQYSMGVKTYGGERRLKITTNYLIDTPGLATDSVAEARIASGLAQVGEFAFEGESRKVDPTISDDIKSKALLSVGVALIFMFIYIGIRFRNWQYGLGAIVSLVHDVLFVLGLYSMLWGIVGFSLEIDEAFIAVILTVVGYSINDTVVVFDRIREYVREHKRESTIVVFNKAINSTLSRTLNTGMATLLVLVIIFLFGGVSIKGFVFGLFFGTLTGTYSSIFVASAVAVDLLKKKDKLPGA